MKRLVISSYDRYDGPKKGYLYILKHGIGPGTLPKDVYLMNTEDLPNGYTAIWINRFLTSNELAEYDIPSEIDNNKYLSRVGYCQKDGDIFPCDEVEACGDITASEDICDEYKDRLYSLWDSMSGSDQFATDMALDHLHLSKDSNKSDEQLVDAANEGCRICNEGNSDPEHADEDFYMEEANFDNVLEYLKLYRENLQHCDIDSSTYITATEDTEEDKVYWVQAYLSKPHKGMIEDFATNDWDAALDKLVEYANKGYYIAFDNLASGEGYYYDPDEVLEAVDFGDIYELRRLQSLYEDR